MSEIVIANQRMHANGSEEADGTRRRYGLPKVTVDFPHQTQRNNVSPQVCRTLKLCRVRDKVWSCTMTD